jgi:glyoxylase-like metal-dependent hydrolase (beta-lactamase superfamily II)
MTLKISTITTRFMFNVSVNCYLLSSSRGYIQIDTGMTSKRSKIESELGKAGCQPGDLNLIILTHGDFDHSGNAAYLRTKFGAQIAMHPDDAGMVEHGDMTWNRNKPNIIIRTIMGLFINLKAADRFKPDIYLKAGDQLAKYGLEAEVISIPGHSKGSIGILTADGDLFCGDLLANTDKPQLWSIIDDEPAAHASAERLSSYPIKNIYPGHGAPFPVEALTFA